MADLPDFFPRIGRIANCFEQIMGNRLIVSPHLDDAWFDLGGSITKWRAAGEAVSVIDVFSVQSWIRFDTLPPGLVTVIRKKEEEKNAKRDGVVLEYLDLPEGAIRGYKLVFPQTIDWAKDQLTMRRILTLLPKKSQFQNAASIYFPLGIGGNVDHLLLREAAISLRETILSWGGRIAFYEDLPYATEHQLPTKFIVEMKLIPTLQEIDLEKKCASIRTYESQIDESVVRNIKHHACSLGDGQSAYERVWICPAR